MSGPAAENRGPGWLSEDEPFAPARSAAQIEALKRLLAPPSKRVLDLGCGSGRVLVPLAAAGHRVTGVDRDEQALACCRQSLDEVGSSADLVQSDFLAGFAAAGSAFDAVLCLGNTFLTIADVDAAVGLLARVSGALREGGWFAMDDCPADFWPEVTAGNWQNGVSEDGTMQLVWAESDAVFVLRVGEAVDPSRWDVHEGDRRLRLWTDGALRLAARVGGLSAPERLPEAHLLVMRRERG